MQQELQEIHYRIGELLVNLCNWQRTGIAKAIRVLDDVLARGCDMIDVAFRGRQIELALCRIADIITYRSSLFSLHPIRGAYNYLSEFQESLIWQVVARFKYRFKSIKNAKLRADAHATARKIQKEEPVREAVADLDATLDIEEIAEPSALREDAIDWVIDKAGEVIEQWMPNLFPPFLIQCWDDWEASVWKAVSKFKQRFSVKLRVAPVFEF